MGGTFTCGTIGEAHSFLALLDLSAVMKRVRGNKASKIEAEKAYRHFLLLTWKNRSAGDGPIVPSTLADKVWHVHLIFTANYREMCMSLAGRFIDHNPDGEGATSEYRRQRRERTRELDLTIEPDLRFIASEFLPPEQKPQQRADMGGCDTGGCGCDTSGCDGCGDCD